MIFGLSFPKKILLALAVIFILFIATTQTAAMAAEPLIAAGKEHTVGLKFDGTVVVAGSTRVHGQCGDKNHSADS